MPNWLRRGQNEYTVVLAGVFGILIVAPFERNGVRPLIVVLLGFLLVFAMWTSGVSKYLMGVTAVIVNRLRGHLVVSVRTITGALSVYLLIGLFYTYLYVLVGDIRNDGFFAQTGPHSPVTYLYFSFVTLTTVGYGDYSAGSDVGRMMAVVEALVGQLYLVTVVAVVVGNIGRSRSNRPNDPD
jgi:Ion channel